MLTYIALYSPTGADTTWTSGRALRLVTVGRARSRATSSWPLAKASERELSSGTNWKVMLAALAFVPQYASLRVTLTRDWRTYSTKRNGPVPGTFAPGWVPCFRMLYSGWTTSSMVRRFGCLGVTSTVMSSTTTVTIQVPLDVRGSCSPESLHGKVNKPLQVCPCSPRSDRIPRRLTNMGTPDRA